MKYISEIHALNLNCSLDTCGDWHQSSLIWTPIKLYESNAFIWNDYGIEKMYRYQSIMTLTMLQIIS